MLQDKVNENNPAAHNRSWRDRRFSHSYSFCEKRTDLHTAWKQLLINIASGMQTAHHNSTAKHAQAHMSLFIVLHRDYYYYFLKSIAYSTRLICRKTQKFQWVMKERTCTAHYTLSDEMHKNHQLLMKMYSVFSQCHCLKLLYNNDIAYIIKIDRQLIASGHGVNTWYKPTLSISPKQTPLINTDYTRVHEHSPSAVNSPLVIWKTLPKVCKTRTIPTNTSSVLEPAISDIHWGRCPQFLLLGRRQRKCKIKTNSVWSVAEHSALLHSVCRARCWSYCLTAPEMRGHALPITRFLETPDQNKS